MVSNSCCSLNYERSIRFNFISNSFFFISFYRKKYPISISSNWTTSRFEFYHFPFIIAKKSDHHYIWRWSSISAIDLQNSWNAYFLSNLRSYKMKYILLLTFYGTPIWNILTKSSFHYAPLNICPIFVTCQSFVFLLSIRGSLNIYFSYLKYDLYPGRMGSRFTILYLS